MFQSIFLFEIRYRLRRPATWIYFGLFFLMSFLLMTAAGGGFGEGVNISLGGDGQSVKLNSPYSLQIVMGVFSIFGIIIASSLMGNPVYRDFEYRTHPLYYTTPITKWGYLGGRFLGSYAIAILVFSGIAFGAAVASVMPWVVADRFLASTPSGSYLWPFVVLVWPNLLFTGAIFFTMATLTRNILSTYIGAVILLVAYLTSEAFLSDLKNEHLLAALDAFGLGAVELTTRYWTASDKNTQLLPLNDFMLLNRGVWLTIGFGLLVLCYTRFKFANFATDKAPKKSKKAKAVSAETARYATTLALPKVRLAFTTGMSLRQYWSLSKLEFRGIVRNVYFLAIAGAGAVFLLANSTQIGKMFDTTTYPVTGEVVSVLGGTFFLFLLAIIIYYSGELVWRERDAHVAQIVDATPIPSWVPFMSKLTALCLVQVVLLGVVLFCGLLAQTFKGYFNYELGLYIQALFVHQLSYLWLWCVLAMLVQVTVNNKYVGHFIVVLVYIANIFRGQIGLTHRLFGWAGAPSVPYSDMNGFGHLLEAFWWTKLYWMGFAVLFCMIALLFWVRGTDSTGRWKEARRRLNSGSILGILAGLLIAVGSGGYIFYNTNILNEYRTPKQEEEAQAQFERKYRARFRTMLQPRIVASSVEVDIFPKTRQLHLKGDLIIKNKQAQALDSVLVYWPDDARVKSLGFGSANAIQKFEDTQVAMRLFKLTKPLAPGDSLTLSYDLEYGELGFPNSGTNLNIVENGTFINSQYVPGLGYPESMELSGDKERKEHGFAPKPRMAGRDDLKARGNTYISGDADWIRFTTTVSTDADQIAIAPGYLQKEWVKDGRRYFAYKMDRPMLNFYSWLSARYEKYTDKWVDTAGHRTIPIEIYHHAGHTYNLKRMAEATKEALSYCTRNFSPYQHQQVRILEFPRYETFAQSFANTIPFSEAIGFIAKVDEKDYEDIDYPFYVTAHEVAHQWWAHQVIGGDVAGSTVMSESMAEYSALMVMKHHYGPYTMQKFLKFDLNRYLSGRAFERKKEVPLALVENQAYIHYNKGSVIMYALQEYLGEQRLNAALRGYVKAVAFQGPPYTTSAQFIDSLRKAAPDTLQGMITDLFERITLYDNRVMEASAKKLANGKYQVALTLKSEKFYSDSLGNQKPVAHADYLPIAIFPDKAEDGKPIAPLLATRVKLKTGLNKLTLTVDKKPARAAVDPYNYIVDRELDDNSKDIKL